MSRLRTSIRQMRHYPSAVFGMVLIGLFLFMAAYALVTMPLDEAIRVWRAGEGTWRDLPRNAAPAWFNVWPGVNLPVTQKFDSRVLESSKTTTELGDGLWETRISFPFDYTYDAFPKEVNIFAETSASAARPFLSLTWHTPDGREIPLGDRDLRSSESFFLGQDSRLTRRLQGREAHIGLFRDPNSAENVPLKGRYELVAEVLLFDPTSEVDIDLVVYGQLHGIAGTDHRRRDLSVALLWGAPVALALSLMGALGATVTTMAIAGIGAWYGGRLDDLIQRITEVNMLLPGIPLLLMIGTLVDRNLFLLTAIWVALGIFSSGIKSYRAMFMQIREAPYIEAAQAYSASNMRIVNLYMIPRILPVLVPGFVSIIPNFVFFEATLSVLGLGDPRLPTWGRILSEAHALGALHNGYYYWVLAPSVLLVLAGAGFALVGFALDRIFNPRLRSM